MGDEHDDGTPPPPPVLPAGMMFVPPGGGNGVHGSGPATTPPVPGAAPGPARPGHPATPGPVEHPVAEGLAHILGRQWPVVATAALLALLLGIAYLLVAPKTYTASATLRVAPMDAQAMTGGPGGGSSDAAADEDYLETECVVIKSDAVLALALDKVADTRALRPGGHPLDTLRDGIDATVAKKGKQVLEVSFAARSPREAERIVGAVVDAYRTYNANYVATKADAILQALKTGSSTDQAHLQELRDRMQAIQQATGQAMDGDPANSPAHQTVVSLRKAKFDADQEAVVARSTYQGFAQRTIGDPVKVAAVNRAMGNAGYVPDPQDNLKKVQAELQRQETQLSDVRAQYLPGSVIVRTIQSRIDQLTVDAIVAAKQWQDVSEAHQHDVARSLADAQQTEIEAEVNEAEYRRLQADSKRIQAEQDAVAGQANRYELSKGVGAVNISVLDDPHADMAHPKPSRTKTLALAGLLGLIGGAAAGCLRDWADDRFRNLPAIKLAAGAPVLGAIPNIPTTVAASAADRGQVVHFDPFGDASESYRTLRTALQFGMPPRTKTLLVTSAVPGDGKSTLVSNLAIAMAQASRRVLVVDADLRAPVQHRLFGLPDRTGLASVLAGTDTLDDAIRRTGIHGLDVLPAGPIPHNPAELLNTPDFGDHLNDLADRYDLVLIDSPPVTAVTDARILAASADASLLVVRLGSSTRRQVESARDALRGVGARLIGVAVNGVSRRGNLASASGYYARPESLPSTAPVNLSVPAADPTPAVLAGGRLGQDPLSDAVRTAPARR